MMAGSLVSRAISRVPMMPEPRMKLCDPDNAIFEPPDIVKTMNLACRYCGCLYKVCCRLVKVPSLIRSLLIGEAVRQLLKYNLAFLRLRMRLSLPVGQYCDTNMISSACSARSQARL